MADIYKARVNIDLGEKKQFKKGDAVQGLSKSEVDKLLKDKLIAHVITVPEGSNETLTAANEKIAVLEAKNRELQEALTAAEKAAKK